MDTDKKKFPAFTVVYRLIVVSLILMCYLEVRETKKGSSFEESFLFNVCF